MHNCCGESLRGLHLSNIQRRWSIAMCKCYGETSRGLHPSMIQRRRSDAMYKCYGEWLRGLHPTRITTSGLVRCINAAVHP